MISETESSKARHCIVCCGTLTRCDVHMDTGIVLKDIPCCLKCGWRVGWQVSREVRS